MKKGLGNVNDVDNDKKETVGFLLRCCISVSNIFQLSAFGMLFLPVPHRGKSPSLLRPHLRNYITCSSLSPTSLESFMLFLLLDSGGGPRTLDPKAMWQTSWLLLPRKLPAPLLMHWSVLLKEGKQFISGCDDKHQVKFFLKVKVQVPRDPDHPFCCNTYGRCRCWDPCQLYQSNTIRMLKRAAVVRILGANSLK